MKKSEIFPGEIRHIEIYKKLLNIEIIVIQVIQSTKIFQCKFCPKLGLKLNIFNITQNNLFLHITL